jgi:hypothetical protein
MRIAVNDHVVCKKKPLVKRGFFFDLSFDYFLGFYQFAAVVQEIYKIQPGAYGQPGEPEFACAIARYLFCDQDTTLHICKLYHSHLV